MKSVDLWQKRLTKSLVKKPRNVRLFQMLPEQEFGLQLYTYIAMVPPRIDFSKDRRQATYISYIQRVYMIARTHYCAPNVKCPNVYTNTRRLVSGVLFLGLPREEQALYIVIYDSLHYTRRNLIDSLISIRK